MRNTVHQCTIKKIIFIKPIFCFLFTQLFSYRIHKTRINLPNPVLIATGLMAMLLTISSAAFSWNNHSYSSYVALKDMPQWSRFHRVKVEKLDDVLQMQAKPLTKLLDDQEKYMVSNFPHYAPRPTALEFNPQSKNLVKSFFRAIRVNPNVKIAYYLQDIRQKYPPENKINHQAISIFKDNQWLREYNFIAIQVGDSVNPLDVLTTASDEPDYGLDIGLYNDSETDYGREYGFSVQPFGNPEYEFSSQAPFHMGFYHEAGITFTLASFLKETYPEYRAYLYLSLAKFFFQQGHDYWAWRFLGWGLHYIQDLTQPYHTKVMPGMNTARLLLGNIAASIGLDSAQNKAIQDVSKRHLSIENYAYRMLRDLHENQNTRHPYWMALSLNDSKRERLQQKHIDNNPSYLRNISAKLSYQKADDLDDAISQWPLVLKMHDVHYPIKQIKHDTNSQASQRILIDLLTELGIESRFYVSQAITDIEP